MEGFMKKNMRKITSALLTLCLVFGMFAFSSGQAYAVGESWVLEMTDTLWTGETGWVWVYDENSEEWTEALITYMTSSDPAVVKIEKDDGYYEDDQEFTAYCMKGKGAGTATVTVEYDTPDGETGIFTKEVTVKKYPYAIKSLKVNGKKVTVSKHKYDVTKKVSKSKATVNIKMALKKGWKISSVGATKWTKGGSMSSAKVTKKMLTKGSAIKFPKKYAELWITVGLKKGSDYFTYTFDFYR